MNRAERRRVARGMAKGAVRKDIAKALKPPPETPKAREQLVAESGGRTATGLLVVRNKLHRPGEGKR